MLAAHYPPHHIGEGEVSDHWIMRAAVQSGIEVTVWCEAGNERADIYQGVTVRRSPAAQIKFYQDILQRRPSRVFLSGPITVIPWKIPPATSPVLLLRSQAHLPLVRQLAPILSAIVVPSLYLKQVVHSYQTTFPSDQIVVSYPNLPRIEPLQRSNPRFYTIASAESHRGIDLFLALAAAMPNREFLVADKLHPAAVERVHRQIEVGGNCLISQHHRSMRQIYLLTDALLAPTVPSQHIETFGNEIAEAILHGVPAFTYPIGAPPEFLDHRLLVLRDDTSFEGQRRNWQERLQWAFNNPPAVHEAVQLSARRLDAMQLSTQASSLVHILRTTG